MSNKLTILQVKMTPYPGKGRGLIAMSKMGRYDSGALFFFPSPTNTIPPCFGQNPGVHLQSIPGEP